MKITSISAIPTAPDPVANQWNFLPWNFVFVKVETDEGIVGWGDATCGPMAVVTMVEEFGRLLIGEDPFNIELLWQTMHHRHFARGGPIQNSAAAGIEMALFDIKGQALGVPVYELLGGKLRDRIWIYGRWDGPTPEQAAEFAQSQVATGLTALKGDPFDHRGLFISYEAEKKALDTLEAVREAVGFEVELLVEVHGRLTPAEAIRIGDAIEPYRPFVFEEPVPFENLDAMEKVSQAINVPIATGERIYSPFVFADLLQRQIVAMIQPDVIQCGGISQLKRIAALAEAQYVGVQPHAIHGPMDVLAALHVDASLPNFMIHEGGSRGWFQDACVGDFPVPSDGFLPLPTAPGLGVAIDEDWLAAHPPQEDPGWAPPLGRLPSKQFSNVASP
jgi:galactonate dehydratase